MTSKKKEPSASQCELCGINLPVSDAAKIIHVCIHVKKCERKLENEEEEKKEEITTNELYHTPAELGGLKHVSRNFEMSYFDISKY